MANDYYAVLGIAREADQDEIKRAYLKLNCKYHPDVSEEVDAEERFEELNEAYEVLSDPDKRAMYDRFGTVSPTTGNFGGGRDPVDILAEVFDNLGEFGNFGRGRAGPRRGNDIRASVTLTFEESASGVDKKIEIDRQGTCPVCGGDGAEPGTKSERCSECNGSGQVRRIQKTLLGSFVKITACSMCNGRGKVIYTPCHKCNGTGKVPIRRRLEVRIPAGVDNGICIRLSGEGQPGGYGDPPGNLFIDIHIKSHADFKRQGDNVIVELQINVAQAAQGCVITVPTLEGERQITIPAGTHSGTIFRLRELGIPHLRGSGRGDQLVVVQVVDPTQLSFKLQESLALLKKGFLSWWKRGDLEKD